MRATIPRTMTDVHLLLASQSPRRRELLALLGLRFDTTVVSVSETPHPGEGPADLVARLSRAKARAVTGLCASADNTRYRPIVCACDTVVAVDGRILGKPRDSSDARHMLAELRGREHLVYSGLCLLDAASGQRAEEVVSTVVRMRDYSDAETAAYVATGDPLDKAGAYAIQNGGFFPVARIEGCYASVMGLPLCHLARSLLAFDVDVRPDIPLACESHNGIECLVYSEVLAGSPAQPEPITHG
jgi:septum formation protein